MEIVVCIANFIRPNKFEPCKFDHCGISGDARPEVNFLGAKVSLDYHHGFISKMYRQTQFTLVTV